MNLYRYLFYRIYSWNLRKWGEQDIPQWKAMISVSFMMFINFCSLGMLIEIFGLGRFLIEPTPKVAIAIIMLTLFIINYFQYIYNGKYLDISKIYENETSHKRTINALLLWLYVIVSFAIGIVFALILKELDKVN